MVSTATNGPPFVARVLSVAGIALIAIGAAGYFLPEGPVHWTALIPAALGAVALAASRLRSFGVITAIGLAVCAAALAGGGSALAQLPALLGGEAGAAIASRAATATVAILALAGIAYASVYGRRIS